jgi:hypothetical protein
MSESVVLSPSSVGIRVNTPERGRYLLPLSDVKSDLAVYASVQVRMCSIQPSEATDGVETG